MIRERQQTLRLVKIDGLVRAGKFPNCLKVARDLHVSEKTIQRDFDYLRYELEAPLKFDRRENGYCYTDKTWILPAILLAEGELFTLLLASTALQQYRGTPVAKTLRQVFRKIAGLLPDKMSFPPELVAARFSFTMPPAKPVDERIWVAVVDALLHQRSVRITYRAIESKQDKPRLIDPYHIANLQGEWYVIAHDHRINKLSRFAIAEIEKAKLTETDFQLPQDFDPEDFLFTAFGRYAQYGAVEEVKLRLDKVIVPYLLPSDWQPSEQARRLPDGSVVITMRTASLFEVSRLVLAWGYRVTVVEPPVLKKMVEDEIKLMNSAIKR